MLRPLIAILLLLVVTALVFAGKELETTTGSGSRTTANLTLPISTPDYLSPGKILPNPLISRGRPTFSSAGGMPAVVDGAYGDWNAWRPGNPSPHNPAWLAIQVGGGYSRLLLNWTMSHNANYNEATYGAPGDYLLQTSADSTDGADGSWMTVASVVGNTFRTRSHSFDFTGKSWVRLFVTAPSATSHNSEAVIDEIDVHDISNGAHDTWFFMGDSITAEAFSRFNDRQPSYAARINRINPVYFPAMVDGGIGFERSKEAVSHIDTWLQLNPDAKYWGLGYGTNDARSNNPDVTTFKANMQTVIDKVIAAGRVPVLAKIPYAADNNHNTIPLFNKSIDELTAANGLITGPDLYTWFKTNPQELGPDGVHPTSTGGISINRLWAGAMGSLYQQVERKYKVYLGLCW